MPAVRWTRRELLRYAAGGVGLIGAGVGFEALTEMHRLSVDRVDVPIAGLPHELEGLTICHLADFHRGPRITEAYVRRASALAVSLDADVIVLTGDFISRTWRFAASCAEALSVLRAPLGVFAVRGNHDYWAGDVDAVDYALARVGVKMLTNRSEPVQYRGQHWWLCGVDDAWSGRPDPRAALRDVPDGAFRVLLCHEPDYADALAHMDVPLQLSGHSHGGQVIVPGYGPVVTPFYGRKYPLGLQRVEGSRNLVYTTRGIGVSILPLRINCPPEVTLLRLARGRQGPGTSPTTIAAPLAEGFDRPVPCGAPRAAASLTIEG
jgi:predicted MPP superfamily phosphohydrolase